MQDDAVGRGTMTRRSDEDRGGGDSSSSNEPVQFRTPATRREPRGVGGSRFGFSTGAAGLLYQIVTDIDLNDDDRCKRSYSLCTMCETRRGTHESNEIEEREN